MASFPALRGAVAVARRSPPVFVLGLLMSALVLALLLLLATLSAASWPALSRLQVGPEATVFAARTASARDLADLQARLEQSPGVASVRLFSREDALAALLERSPATGVLPELNPNLLPDALIVRFAAGVAADQIDAAVAGFRRLPRVDAVQADTDWYRKLMALARAAAWVGGAVSGAATLLVVLILVGAIRLQVAASTAEIRTLRLVGANRRFMVRPYACLGAATLLLAALLAIGVVWVVLQAIGPAVRELAQAYGAPFSVPMLPVPWLAGATLGAAAIGGLIGAAAAGRAVAAVGN